MHRYGALVAADASAEEAVDDLWSLACDADLREEIPQVEQMIRWAENDARGITVVNETLEAADRR